MKLAILLLCLMGGPPLAVLILFAISWMIDRNVD